MNHEDRMDAYTVDDAKSLSDLRSWPRERIAAAVAQARDSCAGVGRDPLPEDVSRWPVFTRGVVHSCDWMLREHPEKARKLAANGMGSAKRGANDAK